MSDPSQAARPTLPSAETAFALVSGDMSALPLLARDLLSRAALISVGVKIAGAQFKDAAKYGIAGSMAIEVFVLSYAAVVTRVRRRLA